MTVLKEVGKDTDHPRGLIRSMTDVDVNVTRLIPSDREACRDFDAPSNTS
jgi:hypothetical protein